MITPHSGRNERGCSSLLCHASCPDQPARTSRGSAAEREKKVVGLKRVLQPCENTHTFNSEVDTQTQGLRMKAMILYSERLFK